MNVTRIDLCENFALYISIYYVYINDVEKERKENKNKNEFKKEERKKERQKKVYFMQIIMS